MGLRRTGWALMAAASVVLWATGAAPAAHLQDNPKKHKIVYHLNEPGVDKAKFVLGNIRNHIKGVGGWENIEALELVVHGPALKTFLRTDMDPELKRMLETLQTQGMQFGVCGNTLKGLQITLADVAEGATELPQGGVVRVMELQERGYTYIRP